MWSGISIDDIQDSIYKNFYSHEDIELIKGVEDANLVDIQKLINKAKKIGDVYTAYLLEDVYDELLNSPPKNHPPIPSREELEQRYAKILENGYKRLKQKRKLERSTAI